MNREILKYIELTETPEKVLIWLENRLPKDYILNDVEHIIDYLNHKKKYNLERITYNQLLTKSKEWTKNLIKSSKIKKEKKGDIKIIKKWSNGFKIVKLITEDAYNREGKLMSHCISSYFCKEDEIYSLRDSKNIPHCTLSKNSQQIKGKGNGSINPKYIKYVISFLKYLKIEVRDSEIKNLGYINVENYLEYLHKDTIKCLFKKKYHYLNNKLLDKDKDIYYNLDFLKDIELLELRKDKLICNYDIMEFSNYICNKSNKQSQSENNSQQFQSVDKSKQSQSVDKSKQSQSGDFSQQSQSGHKSQQFQSGHNSQQSQSGYNSQQSQSGNNSQQFQSGNNSQQFQSGENSQQFQSGDFSKQSQSEYFSKQSQSGNNSQQFQSGYNSQQSQSGYNNKQYQSGYNSQQEMLGGNSVAVSTGDKGRVKGKIGCWFALTEFDEQGKIVIVKAGFIDGKKIKEDVWYELKNKKFVEVKK